ncbi:uncharacterized protein G2W53_022017 [Senna tora]|uniref:Uncharacterized protein n=1 Tax=Senna tora TaxID=362788 RepID=A0A834TKI0_9FABA|nr:uncharacterized protein G2W53_022017 [Senna tora]
MEGRDWDGLVLGLRRANREEREKGGMGWFWWWERNTVWWGLVGDVACALEVGVTGVGVWVLRERNREGSRFGEGGMGLRLGVREGSGGYGVLGYGEEEERLEREGRLKRRKRGKKN